MTLVRIRYVKRGKHYHCRVFTKADDGSGTFANCGSLVFDDSEIEDVMGVFACAEWINDEQREAA